MANKPIQNTDIASADVFAKIIAEATALTKQMELADKATTGLAKAIQQTAKGFSANNAGDLQKAINAEKLLTAEIKEQGKRQVDKERIEKQLLTLQKQKIAQTNRERKEQELLTNAYKRESKELNDLRNGYKQLAAAGRENGKVARGMLKDITRLDTKLKGIDQTVGQSQRNVGNYKSALQGLGGTMSKLRNTASQLGLVLGGGMIVRDGFNTLVSYDEKLADIAKTTGLTISEADKLSKALLNIDTRTSVDNLQELAVAAGRLGIKGIENITAFAQTADKVFVALGDDLNGSADEIATALGKIADNFGASDEFGLAKSIEMTGSAINELAANSKANAGDILDFTNRLSGVGAQAGLTIPQVQALGALLSDTGQSIEVASTVLNTLLPKLAENQEEFAEVAGLTAEEFKNILINNPLEALTAVAKGAQSSEGGLVGLNEMLESFGIESARAASIVGILAGETDKLAEFVDRGTGAYLENISVGKEFDLKNQTTGALLEKLGKEWDKQVLGIGATSSAANILKGTLSFLINNLSTILSVVVKVGTAWLAYKSTMVAINLAEKANVAIMALRTGGLKALFTSQTAANASTVAGTTATKGLNTAMKANPIGLLVSGLILLVSQLDLFSTAAERAAKKQAILNGVIQEGTDIALKNTEALGKATADALEKERQLLLAKLKIGKDDQVSKEKAKLLIDQSASQIRFSAIQEKKQLEDLIKLGQKKFKEAGTDGKLRAKISGELEGYANREIELDKLITDSRQVAWNWYFDKIKEVNAAKAAGGKIDKDNQDDEKDRLTGLAKLQKELTDLEKERSDYLVANKGVIDGTYISMTAQTRELENQIAAYKLVLDKLGEVQEAEKRGGSIFKTDGKGVITTEQGKSDVARNGAPNAKSAEQLLADEKARIQAQKDLSQSFTDITIFLIDKRIEALDRENEAQQRNYDEAKSREQEIIELRKAGAVNTEESLAFEREAQAKALKEQEKIAKKKQHLELVNSALNMFNSAVQSGNGNPLGKTIADVSALVGFINTLPTFWTGTDTTVGDSLGTQFSSGKDGVFARVDKSEMILNKGKVDRLKGLGITTTEGILDTIESSRFGATSNMTAIPIFDNSEVVKELGEQKKLLQQIANRPIESTDIAKISNAIKITQQLMSPNKTVNTTQIIRTP